MSNKKHLVFHVLTSLDFGGVERHMEVLSEELESAKMHHIFVAIGHGGAAEDTLRRNGAQTICLNIKIKTPSLFSIYRLVMLINLYRPSVVHAHGAEANFHALLAAALCRVPIRIGEEIGIPSHSKKAIQTYRQIYRTAHRVIAVSKVVSDHLLSINEVPAQKIVCINNPVRLPHSRPNLSMLIVDIFRVCYVGRLEVVKNPIILIKAASLLVKLGVPIEIVVVGDGSQRKEMEQEIDRYGVLAHVKLAGYQTDPANFIRSSSLYVQPSLSEGFSLSLVEAMGCGVPVAATRVGSASDLIVPGVTGWLLEDFSAETLARAVYEAWTAGSQKLYEMGLQARRAVEGRFEPATYLDRIENLYLEVGINKGIAID